MTKPSMVLLEQIQTVNKNDLTEYIGFVDDERLWRQINAALKKHSVYGYTILTGLATFAVYVRNA